MPPKFNLQNVLDVRHNKVEVLEVELGKLLAQQLNTRTLLNSLQELEDNFMEQLGTAQMGEIDMFTITVLRSNILKVGEHIVRVRKELQQMELTVERKRKELVEAKQAEETLQILKRKRLETYNAEQAQIEASAQDDIYIARAFRTR